MAWPPPPRPPMGPPAGPPDGMTWVTVPALTVGFGAPASFLYAALRRRSVALGGAAALYGAGAVGGLTGIAIGGHAAVPGLLLILLTWTVSTVHALIARPRLYPPANARDQMNQQAVALARHRRGLREAARELLKVDPILARELRIGRPDLLPRLFDDGGLIDVNHVPPEVLSRLPGLTYEMVDRIVRTRAQSGGFVSTEELVVHCDLPPSVVSEISEYALYIR